MPSSESDSRSPSATRATSATTTTLGTVGTVVGFMVVVLAIGAGIAGVMFEVLYGGGLVLHNILGVTTRTAALAIGASLVFMATGYTVLH